MQKEVNAFGINVEPTEFDDAMEDLIDLFENQEANAATEREAKVQNTENEKAKAEDIRQKALETFSETKKQTTNLRSFKFQTKSLRCAISSKQS